MNDKRPDECHLHLFRLWFHFKVNLIAMVDAPSLVYHLRNNKKDIFVRVSASYHFQIFKLFR